jgi:cytochrome oxidase Cu insertion factor (SCO1/SenC/PrrC family)
VEDRLTREEQGVLAAVIAWFAITAAWWLLALWPVDNAPQWLERTRYVCFGVNESGLPDGGGWIGLTAGPLGMLSILVVGWSRVFASILHRTTGAMTIGSLGLGVLLLAGGAAWRVADAHESAGARSSTATLPPETYPRLNMPVPALKLTSQTGEPFSLDELGSQPVLVTFAYAHCATVCPVIVRQTLEAQRKLHGSDKYPAVVIVTLDPWRDRPSQLPRMAADWALPEGAAWVLSGSVEEVEAVLTAWNIPRTRNERTGEVTHPSLVYVVDENRRIAFASTGGTENIVALVRRL